MPLTLIHAFVLALTVLLFIVRQRCLCTTIPLKHRPIHLASGDMSYSVVSSSPPYCYVASRGHLAAMSPPICKGDPAIMDNEWMGQEPYEY